MEDKNRDHKNSYWKGIITGAAAMGIICIMSLLIYTNSKAWDSRSVAGETNGAQQTAAKSENGTESGKKEELDVSRISNKISTIQNLIDKYYYFDENNEQVEDWIYKGMLYGLDDVYSAYYNKEDFESMKKSSSGNYCGIGVLVNQHYLTKQASIAKVYENSPAEGAGILVDDIIIGVDDMNVSGTELNKIVEMISGEEGTDVKITVYRKSTDETLELTMKRQKIKVDTITYKMLPDKVGYIAISEFDEVTVEQFKNAIDDLEKQGMEKIVYDLRNCPGGLLDSVVSMLDYILPDGLIVYTEDKHGSRLDEISGQDGHEVKLPTVVLMNGNSASAAEVFSSAIRDYEWGTLAGTTSFGKGIVQNVIPLEDGTAVKLTISSYFTKSGYSIQGNGLEPDVVIEADEEQAKEANVPLKKDKQLQEALKIFDK